MFYGAVRPVGMSYAQDFPDRVSRGFRWRSSLIYIAVTLCGSVLSNSASAEPAPSVAETLAGIRESHKRLLHVAGGIGITYRLEVEQDAAHPVFVWTQGLDGVLNIRWPELRCRVEGPMAGYMVYKQGKYVRETRHTIREANYNFETHAGVGRDDKMLGQIVNYRHAFSAILGFPLLMQSYVEMEQYYVPGENLKSEYWLPNALEQNAYSREGQEVLNGIPCDVVRRRDLDRIWVATKHGHVVCKREYHFGVGKPLRERLQNMDVREVAPNVWMPWRQVREEFDADRPGALKVRYLLNVRAVSVGRLSEEDTRVVLDEKTAKIEDQVTGTLYESAQQKGKTFDSAVQRAQETNLALASTSPSRTTWLLAGVNVALAIGIGMLGRGQRVRRSP